MIIDTHCHMWSRRLVTGPWMEAMINWGIARTGASREVVIERMEQTRFDDTGDELVRDMDEAGIDVSIVFPMDMGLYYGAKDATSLEQRYEIVAQAVRRHEERLIMFGGIDPHRPDAADFVEEAVNRWGVRGIKLWPPLGFAPNDKMCYRLYERCAKLKLPVIVHTGIEISPMHCSGTRPMLVSEAASDFPEVTFIMAHAGFESWEEAATLAWHYPNIYLDTAFWQFKYKASPEKFYRELRAVFSIAGKGKTFFGSDWPVERTSPRVGHIVWTKMMKELHLKPPVPGVEFTEEEVRLFMGEAANRVLKLV